MSSAVEGTNTKDIKLEIHEQELRVTQKEKGENIDARINEISLLKFEALKNEHQMDKLDAKRFELVKKAFVITAIVLAVIAIVSAIAAVFFSVGTIKAGAATLAIISGSVGVTAGFEQLDKTITRYIEWYQVNRNTKNRITKLQVKIERVKTLINERILHLSSLEKSDKKGFTTEIFSEITELNNSIRKIRRELPTKEMLFPLMESPGLYKHLETA